MMRASLKNSSPYKFFNLSQLKESEALLQQKRNSLKPTPTPVKMTPLAPGAAAAAEPSAADPHGDVGGTPGPAAASAASGAQLNEGEVAVPLEWLQAKQRAEARRLTRPCPPRARGAVAVSPPSLPPPHLCGVGWCLANCTAFLVL